MVELNLKQITDRLNTEFTGDTRKLVFWYDDKAEFAEDVECLPLENAQLLKLEPNNQFQIKYFLERQDTTTNYLVYAPFPKPNIRDNHLEDTMLYSTRFHADRVSLICADLRISNQYKPVIEQHIKFFNNKERTQRFYNLKIENFNEETICIGLMSALCRTEICSFDEVLRTLLAEDDLHNSKLLVEFDIYQLTACFWKCCEKQFGYTDPKPTLERFIIALFVTYASQHIHADIPKNWHSFVLYKVGNVISFLDDLMNNYLYHDAYDTLSDYVAGSINFQIMLKQYEPEVFLDCDSFKQVDDEILQWLTEHLLAEDTGAALDNHTIPEICDMRRKMHFGKSVAVAYELLDCAYSLIIASHYTCPDRFEDIIHQYQNTDYLIDTKYRHFYYCYDQLDNTESFEKLRDLVEHIYTNEYLEKQLPVWNTGILEHDALSILPLQRNFFSRYVSSNKDRTVVIISDAMRYEVGYELFKTMQDDPKCTANLTVMMSTLPSYTRLGMAALLPHTVLELTDDGKEVADGVYCHDLTTRQTVLQSTVPHSCCVQFDTIKNMKKMALREVFTGKQVVYVYHDQIDVRGEHAEDEIFVACKEAIEEIKALIHKVATNANTLHFIVTSDHGFIYKRDKVPESGKIDGMTDKGSIVKRRYIVSKQPILCDGICHLELGHLLGNTDDKVVSFPCSTSVFKISGSGGQNYVHGRSSPQEMLIPVIDIKMEKGHMETRTVQIRLISLIQKITNLITTLEFIQSDPISDVVKQTSFRLYFISEENEKISNENMYIADKRDENTRDRIFRIRFTFKNKKYDPNIRYYLVAYDENNGMEVLRHAVVMDVAFSDDFGFEL